MSITQARAGSAATVANSAWADVLPDSFGGCGGLIVGCDTGSAGTLLYAVINKGGATGGTGATVNSNHVHSSGTPSEYATLSAGQSVQFWGTKENPITRLLVKGGTGTATFSWTVNQP